METATLDALRAWLHSELKGGNDMKMLKLLNVGTNDPHEYHWRFMTTDGKIFQISVWEEDPPGQMRIAERIR